MTYSFIAEHASVWPVRLMCEVLEVSASGYYQSKRPRLNGRHGRQARLMVEMRAVHAETRQRYGSPRMHAELESRGHACCVNTNVAAESSSM